MSISFTTYDDDFFYILLFATFSARQRSIQIVGERDMCDILVIFLMFDDLDL